jgi:acetyltransferase-like isoleucine patch superfamily enzyme
VHDLGRVTIGDRCRLGVGIFVEPHPVMGTGAQIASGAVILGSVPPVHRSRQTL